MSLEETKARLISASAVTDVLLAQIEELYFEDADKNDKFLAKALSELHNSRDINLIELIKTVKKQSSTYEFYSIVEALEAAIPALQADVKDVLECLIHLTNEAEYSSATGKACSVFQEFCTSNPKLSEDGINVILSHSEHDIYISFLSGALLSLSTNNITDTICIAKKLSNHKNKSIRSQIYLTMGRVRVDKNKAKEIFDIFFTNIEQNIDCHVSLLSAVFTFGKNYPSCWGHIEQLLRTLPKSIAPDIQHKISHIVAFDGNTIPESILYLLVDKLTTVEPEQTNTINNISYLLVRLVERNLSPLAVELLESLLIGGININSFGYLCRELLVKHNELLNHIITKWFLTGKASLCHAVLDLFNEAIGEDIELDADMSLISDESEKVFVCHKAVGWLFTLPITASSFILSVYKPDNLGSQNELENILYEPLLVSYPGKLKKYFQERTKKSATEELCERLLNQLEKHHENLDKTRHLKELRAPDENINLYWKDFYNRIKTAQDEAPKAFFEHFCTVQNILYGNSSIYYLNQINSEPIRQEMQMNSFSHSTEIPHLNIVAHQSLDYILRIFRCERIKSEINS